MNDILFTKSVFAPAYNSLLKQDFNSFLLLKSTTFSKELLKSTYQKVYSKAIRNIWERLLITELNFANKDNLIPGKTEDEKFDFFVNNVCNADNLASIYDKCPGLQNIWEKEKQVTTQALIKMLDRIEADMPEVIEHFFKNKILKSVQEVTVTGDPHKSRQQTAEVKLQFTDNTTGSVYYKPRDLTLDEGFETFLLWWNENAPISHLSPKVLKKQNYGWAQEIKYQACNTPEEVVNFYKRYGSLIALTYAFATTDIHMENIVSYKDFPVIIDIETLFSCTIEGYDSNYSIYSALMLPSATTSMGNEISPLTAKEGQEINTKYLRNPNKKKIDLQMEKATIFSKQHKNQVILNSEVVDFNDYSDYIIEGFTETYNFILNNKQKCLDVLFKSMKNAKVRILCRSTADYSLAMYNKFHPDVLYNKGQNKELNTLIKQKRGTEIFLSEVADLNHGDIPYFEIGFDEKVLTNGVDTKILNQVKDSPKQLIIQQFEGMNNYLLLDQIQSIKFAFVASKVRDDLKASQDIKQIDYTPSSNIKVKQHESIKDISLFALEEIYKRVVVRDGLMQWHKVDFIGKSVGASYTNIDLYAGASGIAYTFYNIGKLYKVEKYITFAKQLFDYTTTKLSDAPMGTLGAYGHSAALLPLALYHSQDLHNIYDVAASELTKIASAINLSRYDDYDSIDIISGLAGTMQLLLKLKVIFKDYPLANTIKAILDNAFIILKVKSLDLFTKDTLLGYAHGTAGVSAALAGYMNVMGKDDQAVKIIAKHIEHENSYKTNQGWKDLRDRASVKYSNSWCHGTAGFAFSRLHIKPYISQDQLNSDISTIISHLGRTQSSLAPCHGMSADLLICKMLSSKQNLEPEYKKIQAEIISIINSKGYITSWGLNNFEDSSYMTGTAGIISMLNNFSFII